VSTRVAITGIGLASPLGCGRAEFWEQLRRGVSAIGPVTTLDLSGSPVRIGAEVKDFRPEEHLGGKGLKYVGRGTKLLCVAVAQALADAGLSEDERATDETGLVVGTAHGNFAQTTDYTQKILTHNPAELLPMEGFDAALNSATNFAAVRFRLKACTRTVSSGFASSTDALGDAAWMIRAGQAKRVVAGGMEQLSVDAFLLSSLNGELARGEGEGLSMPFDRRRCGFVLGEGSYVFVLEDKREALERGARIYGEVAGYGCLFSGGTRRAHAVGRVMDLALTRAGLAPHDVDLVSACANSSREADRIEAEAITGLLGKGVLVTAVKSMLGECGGASGALQTAAALLALEHGTIPPTIHTTEKDPEIELGTLVSRPIERSVRTALIPSIDPSGHSACVVVQRG
jgi:3-oxoacyl-[acyl-carrier-protein] synthase II